MAIKLSQGLKQQQNLAMTPQLQQAIKLLTLTHQEMTAEIARELIENPLLEEVGGDSGSEGEKNEADYREEKLEMQGQEATSESFEGKETAKNNEEFDWDKYVDTYNDTSSTPSLVQSKETEELPNYEGVVSKEMDLSDYLDWQLKVNDLGQREITIAKMIIYNLNGEGYLDIALEDIASELDCPIEEVLEVLKIVQALDPVGCGSRSLQECLTCQARALETSSPLVELIIEKYFTCLSTHDYSPVINALGVSEEKITEAVNIIKQFSPRPGRSVSPENIQYVVPDIFVVKIGTEYVVQVNNDGVPRLRISKLYQSLIGMDQGDRNAKEYIKEKVKSAIWLIKSIQNRQRTIEKVAQTIVRQQQDFFKKGPQHLKPMILKDVANELGVHESTVSRVTSNKYMHTPIGLFELKYFFSTGIGGKNGGVDISSEVLKIKIKKLIESENPQKPLSDQRIVEILENEDLVIARRTVSKYREMLGIDSSSRRKKSR